MPTPKGQLVTPRAVDLTEPEGETPREKLNRLNSRLQSLHFSHNETRRIMPHIVDALCACVNGLLDGAEFTGPDFPPFAEGTKKANKPKKTTPSEEKTDG